MNKKIYSTLVFLMVASNVFSQLTFQRLVGGTQHERAQTVLNTFDNMYLINAATGSFGAGGIDAMLMKMDLTGQIVWSNTYGTAAYDNSEFAIETGDHGFVCVGRSEINSGAPTSAIIFKTDSAGNVLWSRSYGGSANDGFIHVTETSDQGLAAVGYTSTLSSGSTDILLVRTDINGDTVFSRAYGSPDNESGGYVIQLPDNGFLIAGRQSTNNGTQADGVLVRTDSMGNQLWTKIYGDTLFDEFTSVKQLSDGFIVTGSTVSYGSGGFDIMLMKTDTAGTIIWSKTFGGAESDAAYDIHITSDSGYMISGFTEGYGHRTAGADDANIFLMKTDITGSFLWMQVYGDGLQDEAYRSDIAADGGFIIGGFTTNYLLTDSSQMIIIKTDTVGISGCHEEAAIPVDSSVGVAFFDTLFTQLSGLSIGTLSLTTGAVVVNNDDACLYSGSLQTSVSKEETFVAYPNPFSEELIIDAGNDISDIYLYDAFGRLHYFQENVSQVITFNGNNLSTGIYFLKIKSGSILKIIPVVKSAGH